ncbi:SLC13 family permease [Mordavella massiliensis]|uniref:Sodium-dependent dicarboxylate transporter SdcS n=1 Tax=Mordavella massiliensis TaxID=1871024 RepID=A0A938XCD2_9CLOT|nr:SLC13 family permease [Mordavella massiliensis]MBM6948462.1 anion permease [Mordavella massiliensis]
MQSKKSVKDTAFLILALVVIIGSRLMPETAGLSKDAWAVLGVFFGSLIMWIGISIDWPSMITLLALGMLPVFGFSGTFAGAFGNTTVAFLLFTFMLVYPLSKTNFVRRCTVFFITNRIARRGPWYFICFLLAAVTFMGLFISPSVLFVAFMPFLEDIFKVLELKRGGKAGNVIMMGTAFCISLSSGMTAIGHVWPTMAIGYYTAATGNDVNQFQYMAMGIPAGIILIIILILIFKFIYRPDDVHTIQPEKAMALRGTVPAADFKEKVILGVMALTVVLWVGPSLVKGVLPQVYETINSWSTAMPPLLGCVILFIVRVDGESIMNFKETVSKGVLWGSVLMTAAATQLGSCLTNEDVGISAWLTGALEPLTANLPVIGLILFFMTWAVVETNFSSNIVTTTVVSSVALSVLTALPAGSVNVGVVVCMVGFAAAICNMTPAGQSTVNTVAIGSGWTDTKSMFVWGGLFAIAGILVLSFIAYPLGSLFIS